MLAVTDIFSASWTSFQRQRITAEDTGAFNMPRRKQHRLQPACLLFLFQYDVIALAIGEGSTSYIAAAVFVYRPLAFQAIRVCICGGLFVSCNSNSPICLLLKNASHKVLPSLEYFVRFNPKCFKSEPRPAVSIGRLCENIKVRQENLLDVFPREIKSILFPLVRCR